MSRTNGFSEMHSACEQYLAKRPFQGKVRVFQDKAKVKELCRGPGEMGWKSVRWDGENKLWGTMEMASVPKLLSSGKWEPAGIQRHWYGYLSQMAKAKSFIQDKVKTENQEKMAVINDQNEKERIAALQERKRRQDEQDERNKIKSMLDPTDEEIKKVADLGFDEGVPAYALRLDTAFGTVAGMSPEGRVLRWFGFKTTEARVNAYSDTGAKWMTPDDLAPYYAAAKDRWVKALNEAARRGHSAFDDHLASKRTKTKYAGNKRKIYDDVDTGETTERAKSAEADTFAAHDAKKHAVEVVPSCANYGAYCNTCHGIISPQFLECLCTPGWVSCHACGTFVAQHQQCCFGHEVRYPVESEPLFRGS